MLRDRLNPGHNSDKQQSHSSRRDVIKWVSGLSLSAAVTTQPAAAYDHYEDDSPDVDYTPTTGSVSFVTPDSDVTVSSPVSFEMEATDFIIEPASAGVTDGRGHLHILVDKPFVESGEVIPSTSGYYHYGDGSVKAEISGIGAGTHTIRLQAGDAKHRAYDLTDEINIEVEESDAGVDSEIVMDNVGSSAWKVPTADKEYVEVTSEENPTLTLETGIRYKITNKGYSAHPLAFRDTTESALLTQSGTGKFEEDSAVNWIDEGSAIEFTLTDELAGEINSYICTVHSSMVGNIETVDSEPDGGGSDSSIETYTNEDGLIDPGGLGDAAADFRAGEIEPGTLGDVAEAFRTGEPII